MFKISYVSSIDGLKIARDLLRRIYEENPKHWPNSLTPEHFDGGLYLIREASSGTPVGFCGWQERDEVQPLLDRPVDVRRKEAGDLHVPAWDSFFKSMGCRHVKTGYYSIGILREHRRNGFAKEALQKLISIKSAGVDRVRALIMASNSPSLALADSLGVEKVVKRAFTLPWQRKQPDATDFIPGAVVGAGLGAGVKFDRDLNRARGKLEDWQRAMRRYQGVTGAKNYTGRIDPGLAAKIIDDYILHGQATAQSKLLGVPPGRILQGIVRPFDRYGSDHYRFFSDPRITLPELRRHMIDKAVTRRFGAEYANPAIFTPEMKAALDNWVVQKNYSLPNVTRLFSKVYAGSPAAHMLDSALYGTKGNVAIQNIGEAMRLAGNRGTVMSTPDFYAAAANKFLLKPWAKMRWPFGIGGGLAAAGLLGSAAFRKWGSTDTTKDMLAGAGLLGLGAGFGGSGYSDWANPNRRIGLTYGAMSGPWGLGDVGHGHKAPAASIRELLEQAKATNPNLSKFDLVDVPRNRAGILQGPQGKYNVMVDTGLGAYNADFVSGPRITHGVNSFQQFSATTHMPILTDIKPSDRSRFGASFPMQRNHEYLGYGPGFEESAKARGWNARSISPGLTPAISAASLQNLSRPVSRPEVLADLAETFAAKNPGAAMRLADAAVGGKKLIVISGSGRGDYVATRARDLAKAVRRAGMGDQVQIIAQLAGSYDDPLTQRIMATVPEVLALPKMPNVPFQNLQRIADVHWGSTGTSSLAESMMHGNVLALPEDWGYRSKWTGAGFSERITPGTPAWLQTRHHRALKDPSLAHGQVPITTWNRGNMQYAHSRPGVVAANRGTDILKLLQDPAALGSLQQSAKSRAAEEMSRLMSGRQIIADSILQRAVKNVGRQQLQGKLKLLGALGAVLSGSYLMTRQHE